MDFQIRISAVFEEENVIEHVPWVGNKYGKGLGNRGQRVVIVGHSHYLREGKDRNMLTHDVVRAVQGGKREPFFTKIRSYFEDIEAIDDREFWDRVVFLNFVPSVVGSDKEKNKRGSQAQIDRGRERFRRVLKEHLPQKVLVFSNSSGKGWQTLPDTDEEAIGQKLFRLGPGNLQKFTWGTYKVRGNTILAFGLQHPERARNEIMKAAVRHVMAI